VQYPVRIDANEKEKAVKLRSRAGVLMLMTGCLVTAGGCAPQASALSKLQSGEIGTLNSSEWVALAGLGTELGIPVPQLTVEQADVLVGFLQANNIETIEDLQNLISSGHLNIPQDVIDLVYGAG
jgi:hypothetical protein